jgi:hypothetical protein
VSGSLLFAALKTYGSCRAKRIFDASLSFPSSSIIQEGNLEATPPTLSRIAVFSCFLSRLVFCLRMTMKLFLMRQYLLRGRLGSLLSLSHFFLPLLASPFWVNKAEAERMFSAFHTKHFLPAPKIAIGPNNIALGFAVNELNQMQLLLETLSRARLDCNSHEFMVDKPSPRQVC